MKLRLRGDSIRLRLTRGEVQALVTDGVVAERTRLPVGPAFGYELRADGALRAPTATFEGGVLGVAVPRAAAASWAASDEEGMRADVPVAGGTLAIVVEKDFPCATSRAGEDDSDAFERRGPAARC